MTNKTQLFTTKVKAALSEEEFEAAMSDYQEKQTEFATKKDELQKPYIRSVEIAGFGTYNYDYICKVDDPVRIVADFEFDKYSGDKTKAFVFLVYPESQMTVQYPAQSWHNFGLDRSRNPKLLAVLPNNKLAVYTDDIRKSYEKDAFTYHMTVLEEDISSKGALEKAIAQL